MKNAKIQKYTILYIFTENWKFCFKNEQMPFSATEFTNFYAKLLRRNIIFPKIAKIRKSRKIEIHQNLIIL